MPGGRDRRLLGARRRAVGARERRRAAAEHDRRDLPARHEGARAGAPLRRRRLHRPPDRPRGPRGGRRDDGRGARLDRARRVGRRRRARSTFPAGRGSPTSRRRRCRSTRRARSSPRCAAASPTSTRRRRKTSVTRPPTASGRSRRCSREIDLLLVIGSRNSSNSNRLVEVARAGGVAAYLIDDETEIDEAWIDGVEVVGVTSRRVRAGEARRARLRLVPRARRRPRSSRTGSSTRTSSSGCRSSCAASSRSPKRSASDWTGGGAEPASVGQLVGLVVAEAPRRQDPLPLPAARRRGARCA